MKYCLFPEFPPVVPWSFLPGTRYQSRYKPLLVTGASGIRQPLRSGSGSFRRVRPRSLQVAPSCRRAVPLFYRTIRGFRGALQLTLSGDTSNRAAWVGDSLAFVSTFLVLGAPTPSRSLKQVDPSPFRNRFLALMLLRVLSRFQRSPLHCFGSRRVARADVAAVTSETGHQPASMPPSSFCTILAVYSSSTLPGYCTELPVLGFVMFCRHKDESPPRVSALQSFTP